MAQLQRRRHVRFVHEAEVQQHAEEPVAIGLHLKALLLRHPWPILADHRQQHHLAVQHLVMQHVVQQRMGYRIGARREEHRRAFDPVRRLNADTADEQLQRQRAFVDTLHQDLLAALPGAHQQEQHSAGQDREGSTLDDLRHVGGKEQPIHKQETQQDRHRQHRWPLPQQQHHRRDQERGHQHGTGHRHAVGRRQGAGRPEADHQQHHANHQRPVHRTDVDLPLLVAGGVLDLHAWNVAQLDGLAGQGEGPRDHRLRGDHRGHGGQPDQRQQCPARRQQVEGVTCRLRVLQQYRALAKVVEHQRRQHQDEPGAGDRLAAKVAHVGVQRLGTGQRQHHRAEDGHAHAGVNHEEVHRPDRVECLEHFRALRDAMRSQRAQRHEPGDHDRAEQLADLLGAVLLHQEQRHQHHQRNRHNPVVDAFEGQPHALDRRQHRHRRGDHAVAIEQRSADQPAHHHQRTQPRVGRRGPPRQCSQCHGAALALVVGAQDEHHVLERHHPQQRPQDQRQDPQHAVMVDRHSVPAAEDFLEGIQRAGTDIAINHPDRRHEQAQ
ncbi:hypothetical protein D3C72_1065920 [compost metagenome]